MFKSLLFLPLLISLSSLVVSEDACTGSQAVSTANRKIGIVIDSSGSNSWTDPTDLRITAGKKLAASLLPTDLVTVIDFDFSATVIYPLGPPAKASFAGIDSIGGTNIASGVEAAIDQITGNKKDVTSGVSGIVVLTDGEDNGGPADLVAQLVRAKNLGIRVSFGFLSPDDSTATQDPTVLSAILATSGVYSTISSAAAQAQFVSLVLSHGLVNSDTSSATSTLLLPGLVTAGSANATSGERTYSYSAVAGEKLNFTITAITAGATFDIKLQAKKDSKTVLKSGTTGTTGVVSLLYTSAVNGELELIIDTKDTKTGLFSVSLSSSVKKTVTLCGSGNNNNSTSPQPSGTGVATPQGTGTSPPLSTGTGSGVPGGNNNNSTAPATPSAPPVPPVFTSGAGSLRDVARGMGASLLVLAGVAALF